MQRITSLVTLCLFALLFCMIAHTSQHQTPFSPEEKQEGSPSPVPRSVRPPDKDKPPVKIPDLLLRARPEPAPAEEKILNNVEVKSVEEPGTNTLNDPSTREEASSRALQQEQNNIHFLLIGRWWEEPSAEVLMMVTLIPGSRARLTAVDPAIEVTLGNRSCQIGKLSAPGSDYGQLYRAITGLTGLAPQFYIDLNLHGFIKIIDLLQKTGLDNASSCNTGTVPPGYAQLAQTNGDKALLLLNDFTAQTAVKEELLIGYLLIAREIQFTKPGLELLWMGYHNLKTNLTLSDLLQIRKVTQGISPTDVSLTEITR